MNLELEVVQPICVQKITIFGHVRWLSIEDVDIFHQDVSDFHVLKLEILGMSYS